MIQIEPVSKEYLDYVLKNLSEADEFEMIQEFGIIYYDILIKECISDDIKIMLDESGVPIGLFGLREIQTDVGEVCLLVTDEFKYHFKSFLNQAQDCIKNWLKKYDRLENWIYKSNESGIKWLKKLGFKMVKYDENRNYFYIEKEDKCLI